MTLNLNLKGGVIINDEWERGQSAGRTDAFAALHYFIENCSRVQILTDTSISCVTYVLTLRDDVLSPYVTIRSTNLLEQVTKIFFKIGFLSKTDKRKMIQFQRSLAPQYDRKRGEIQALTRSDVEREVAIQNDLFKKSSTDEHSLLEPICPGIICYSVDVNQDFKNYLAEKFLEILADRRLVDKDSSGRHYTITDDLVTQGLFSNETRTNDIYFIVMEFMKGYTVLGDILDDSIYTEEQKNIYKIMHLYELERMKKYGYMHDDPHFRNVMINPDYPYFTTDKRDRYYGRALIIDFGRVISLSGEERQGLSRTVITTRLQREQVLLQRFQPIFKDFDQRRSIMTREFLESIGSEKREQLEESIRAHSIELQRPPISTPDPVPVQGVGDLLPNTVFGFKYDDENNSNYIDVFKGGNQDEAKEAVDTNFKVENKNIRNDVFGKMINGLFEDPAKLNISVRGGRNVKSKTRRRRGGSRRRQHGSRRRRQGGGRRRSI